jgi:hypothetical protein
LRACKPCTGRSNSARNRGFYEGEVVRVEIGDADRLMRSFVSRDDVQRIEYDFTLHILFQEIGSRYDVKRREFVAAYLVFVVPQEPHYVEIQTNIYKRHVQSTFHVCHEY